MKQYTCRLQTSQLSMCRPATYLSVWLLCAAQQAPATNARRAKGIREKATGNMVTTCLPLKIGNMRQCTACQLRTGEFTCWMYQHCEGHSGPCCIYQQSPQRYSEPIERMRLCALLTCHQPSLSPQGWSWQSSRRHPPSCWLAHPGLPSGSLVSSC